MSNPFDLTKLHVLKFAQSFSHAQGQEPLSRFERLLFEQDQAQEQNQESQGQVLDLGSESDLVRDLFEKKRVDWQLDGFFDGDELGANAALNARAGFVLQAQAAIPMTCQRCLGACVQALQVHRTFRFVRDEKTALEMDDNSEDEFLVLSNAFDVLELMEEELIMAVPLVPLHDHCPVPLTQQLLSKSSSEDEIEEKRPNPFAILSTLKTQKS